MNRSSIDWLGFDLSSKLNLFCPIIISFPCPLQSFSFFSSTATASVTATASATAANIASSDGNQCFHGSTADKFHPNGEYMKAVEEYFDMRFQVVSLESRNGSQAQQEMFIQMGLKYDEDHMHLMKDPGFYRFIFALCTKKYLDGCNLKARPQHFLMHALLTLGIMRRYSTTPKVFDKYIRDILTERGMIKVLVRETAAYCPCMNEGKDIAKTMDKNGKCGGCRKEFPKKTLSFCNGCQYVKYHSPECQINHWHIHKSDCKKLGSNPKV